MLRFLLGLAFLFFLAVVGIFAFQNTQTITVKFLNWGLTAPVAILAIGAYFLGMISGWNVIAYMRSSIRRVTAPTNRD